MNEVLAIVLGGGQGARLFPLTATRSKPAVPIGGKYRLVDVPISNCLHAEIRRIFVLTQFNSASLNRHIAQTYRLDLFSNGFVEILAAEQTPDNPHWFQGTADAVRQAARHFVGYPADYYLILAGDHIYRMDFSELIEDHIRRNADITIAAQPVSPEEAPSLGIFCFDRDGRIAAFEEKPTAARLAHIQSSLPARTSFGGSADKPFLASMGIYVFSRQVLIDTLESHSGVDFGRELIPTALNSRTVSAYVYGGYWADVGTIRSFYDANVLLTQPSAPFSFYHPGRPIFTHQRFLPPSRFKATTVIDAIVADGCFLDSCEIRESVVGVRTHINRGSRITRSVLLGADQYEGDDEASARERPPLGIGREVVLDRVIIDKNARIGDGARLVNAQQVEDADGDGYYIRSGIIVVPKDGVVKEGTAV